MSVVEMAFGKNAEEQLVHVSDAKNGLACDCRCIECNAPLVAKQGAVLEWHFAHAAKTSCQGYNPETLLHKRAKYLIAEMVERDGLHSFLPNKLFNKLSYKVFGYRVADTSSRFPSILRTCVLDMELVLMDEYTKLLKNVLPDKGIVVEVEGISPCKGYRPDVALYPENGYSNPFTGIEVIVTHGVSKDKETKILDAKDASVWVKLSDVDRSCTEEELVEAVKNNTVVASYGEGHLDKYVHEVIRYWTDSRHLENLKLRICEWLKVTTAEFSIQKTVNSDIKIKFENVEKRLLKEENERKEEREKEQKLIKMPYGVSPDGKLTHANGESLTYYGESYRCLSCGGPIKIHSENRHNKVWIHSTESNCCGTSGSDIREAVAISRIIDVIEIYGLHSILPKKFSSGEFGSLSLYGERLIKLIPNYGTEFDIFNFIPDTVENLTSRFIGGGPDIEIRENGYKPLLIDVVNMNETYSYMYKDIKTKAESRKDDIYFQVQYSSDICGLEDEELMNYIISNLKIGSLGHGKIDQEFCKLLENEIEDYELEDEISKFLDTKYFSWYISDGLNLEIYID